MDKRMQKTASFIRSIYNMNLKFLGNGDASYAVSYAILQKNFI